MQASLSTGLCYAVPSLTKSQAIRVCNCSVSRSIPNPSFANTRNCNQALTMATSGTISASGDLVVDSLISSCGNFTNVVLPSGVYYGNKSLRYCQKANLGLKARATGGGHSSYASHRFRCKSKIWNSKSTLFAGLWFNGLHTSSVQCYSDGATPSVALDELGYDEQLNNSAVSIEKGLKLQSGSCYLPHPEKVKTGGEDAHFICKDEQVIGIADGVGGWAEVGVNAGIYARELMSNSVSAIKNEPKGSINPARVLERAHSVTNEKGSSTACIITLTNKNLHAINLGDSGFIVVRDGHTIFESPVQQHGFNFTYQLENSQTGDLPSSGQVFTIPVTPGDVIVAGTDGLFDNLYNNEITQIVIEGFSTGLGPQEIAQHIAALARERALDRKRQTPFSTAAQEAGYRYFGGKLDDTTVVVSFVTSSTSL